MLKEKGQIILSDERMNTYGCVVVTSGIDTDDFLRNPVLLLNHNPDILLGSIENLQMQDGKLIGTPVFDDDDAEATKWAGKWSRGFLKAASVHLDINETQLINDAVHITKSTLCEVSLTPIPGNKNALRLTREGKEISQDEIKLMLNSNSKQTIMNKLQLMAKSLGLALTVTEDEVLSKIEALVESEKAKADEISKLKLSVKEKEDAEAAAFDKKCIQLVDDAAAAGKIGKDKDTKDTYVRFAKVDFDGTKKMLDSVAERMPLSQRVNNESGNAAPADRAGWSFRDWEKKDSRGLRLMKKENPEQYKALLDSLNAELKSKGAI